MSSMDPKAFSSANITYVFVGIKIQFDGYNKQFVMEKFNVKFESSSHL